MFRNNPILIFLGKFTLIYALLLIFISLFSINDSYINSFRTINKTIFGKLGQEGMVVFEPQTAEATKGKQTAFNNKSTHDTKITIINRTKASQAAKAAQARGEKSVSKDYYQILTINSWNLGGLPTLFVLALILATPLLWRQKLWALLWGTLLINAFILFKMWIALLNEANKNPKLDVAVLPSLLKSLVESTYIITSFLGFNLILAILIWILVAFKKDSWQALLRK